MNVFSRDAILDMVGAGRGSNEGIWIPYAFVEWLGSYTSAAMLNQILFYRDLKRREGKQEFYMTYDMWREKLHLTERDVRNGLEAVRKIGVYTKAKRAPNGDRVLYYWVNAEEFLNALHAFLTRRSVRIVPSETDATYLPGAYESYERSYTEESTEESTERDRADADTGFFVNPTLTGDKQTPATLGGDLDGTLPDTAPAPAPRPAVHACEDKPVTVRLPEPDPFDALTRQPGERIIPGTKGAPARNTRHQPPATQHPTFAPTLAELLRIYPDRKDGAKQNAKLAYQALALIDPAQYPQLLANAGEYARRVKAGLRTDPRTPVMNLATFLSNDEWTYHAPPPPASGATSGPRVVFGTRKGTPDER